MSTPMDEILAALHRPRTTVEEILAAIERARVDGERLRRYEAEKAAKRP